MLARILEPDGIGLLTIVGTTTSLLWPVLSLNLHTAVATFLVGVSDPRTVRRFLYSNLVTSLLGAAAGSALFLAWRPAMLGPLVGLTVAYVFVTILREYAVLIPQLNQRLRFVAIVSFAIEYGGGALAVILVALGYGVKGALLGWTLPLGIVSLVVMALVIQDLGWGGRFDRSAVRQCLMYGLPLVPISVSQWVVQASDNYLLMSWRGAAEVGIYSVGYSLASIVLVIPAMFNHVWYPTIVRLASEGSRRIEDFVSFAVRATWFLIGVCTVIFVAAGSAVAAWFAGPSFRDAGLVAAVLVLGYAGMQTTGIFQGVFVTYDKSPYPLASIHLATAVVNTVLNLALIPRYGMLGAAVATATAYWTGGALAHNLVARRTPLHDDAIRRDLYRSIATAVGGVVCSCVVRWAAPAGWGSLVVALVSGLTTCLTLALGWRVVRPAELRWMRHVLLRGTRA